MHGAEVHYEHTSSPDPARSRVRAPFSPAATLGHRIRTQSLCR